MIATLALGGIRFGEPWFVLLALLVPVAFALGARRRPRLLFPAPLVAGLPLGRRARLRALGPALQGLGLAGFALALARPLSGKEETLLFSEGIDIALAVDRSGSMRHQDMSQEKSRLAVVKEVVAEFVKERRSDRLALVAFARFAELRCPFTLDGDALVGFLRQIEPVGPRERDEDGTAIGVGLARAVEALRNTPSKGKVAILLTDGENNIEDILPKEAAAFAKASGVRVYTIAAGRFVFVQHPLTRQFEATDRTIDSTDLETIAAETGGRFFRAGDAEELAEVYAEIDRLEKTKVEDRRYTEYTDLYPFALLPAIALFLAGALLKFGSLRTLP